MTHFQEPTPLADAKSARLVFLGTKDFALPSFEYLCRNGWQILALITQPDRPQGRKQQLIPSKIKCFAQAQGIPVLQPEDLNSPEATQTLAELRPDLLVTVAYGQILKPYILSIAPFGGVNLHGSLLPKYRGAAPVARALEQGDLHTGVTVIQMSAQVDAGGMLAIAFTPIGPEDNALTLEAHLAEIGAPVLGEAIRNYLEGNLEPIHQDGSSASRAPKLTKEESFIDWYAPAFKVDRFIRAMNPWPLARSHFHAKSNQKSILVMIHHSHLSDSDVKSSAEPGQIIAITKDHIEVACGDGHGVELKSIQTDGRNLLPITDWARGMRPTVGDQFLREKRLGL